MWQNELKFPFLQICYEERFFCHKSSISVVTIIIIIMAIIIKKQEWPYQTLYQNCCWIFFLCKYVEISTEVDCRIVSLTAEKKNNFIHPKRISSLCTRWIIGSALDLPKIERLDGPWHECICAIDKMVWVFLRGTRQIQTQSFPSETLRIWLNQNFKDLICMMNCPTYVLITDKKPEYSHDHCGLTAPSTWE